MTWEEFACQILALPEKERKRPAWTEYDGSLTEIGPFSLVKPEEYEAVWWDRQTDGDYKVGDWVLK